MFHNPRSAALRSVFANIIAFFQTKTCSVQLERQLESMAVRALKMLILLHRPGVVVPTRTVDWLNMRGWLNNHIHIRGPRRLFIRTRKSRLVRCLFATFFRVNLTSSVWSLISRYRQIFLPTGRMLEKTNESTC